MLIQPGRRIFGVSDAAKRYKLPQSDAHARAVLQMGLIGTKGTTSSRLTCTVALATCNGAAFLPEQLRSIREQTRLPDEIVVVDDASDDESFEIVRTASAGAPIHANRNPTRVGVTKNFENACRRASGSVIFLCDQDDIWCREKIERMMSEFEGRSDLLLLHSDANLVDRNGAPLGLSLFNALELRPAELRSIHAGKAYRILFRRNVVTGATTAFRRELLAAALPLPLEWLHDEWLGMVASMTGVVDALEQPLIDYRQHGGNQVGAQRKSWWTRYREIKGGSAPYRDRLTVRATALRDRVEQLGDRVPSAIRLLANEYYRHAIVRANLPPSKRARLSTVVTEILAGRYGTCSRGLRTILADLVEPIGSNRVSATASSARGPG